MKLPKKDRAAYLRIARDVGVFRAGEIRILEEVLEEYEDYPDLYYFFVERQGDDIIGFAVLSWVDLTEFAWDLYWLVVDAPHQGQGVGKKLLKRVEEHILAKQKRAILRVETSRKKEFSHARRLYENRGFTEAGRIKDFYGTGDDLIVYKKDLRRPRRRAKARRGRRQ